MKKPRLGIARAGLESIAWRLNRDGQVFPFFAFLLLFLFVIIVIIIVVI